MPTPTRAVKVNPNTGALIAPNAATFTTANGIALLSDLTSFFDFKGAIACAGNPNYPVALKGDVYAVSSAGKIGGASGIVVEIGDTILATADNAGGTQAAVGSSWVVNQNNIDQSNIAITGGTIDGTVIGDTTPAAGTFTFVNGATIGADAITLSSGSILNLYSCAATMQGTVQLNDNGTMTLGAYVYTFPAASSTMATLAGTEALTNKTYEGNTITAGTGTLLLDNGSTLTILNDATIQGSGAIVITGYFAGSDVSLPASGLLLSNATAVTVAQGGTDATTASGARTNLGLVIGTDVQAYDSDLTAWAGVTPGTGVTTALAVAVGGAGAFVTFNGAGGTPSSLTLTNATALPVSGITASTSTAIGVGSVELGHATDTTITRVSAGVIAVEGATVRTGTVAEANGGTGFTELPKFHVYKSSDQVLTGGSYQKITWGNEEFDTGNDFASDTFTAPIAGKYMFGCYLYSGSAAVTASIALYKNGTQVKRLAQQNTLATGAIMGGNVVIALAANDTVDIYTYPSSGMTWTGAQSIAYFYGHLLAGG
jgi:hypothetical protein